jgi:hypothetical protein
VPSSKSGYEIYRSSKVGFKPVAVLPAVNNNSGSSSRTSKMKSNIGNSYVAPIERLKRKSPTVTSEEQGILSSGYMKRKYKMYLYQNTFLYSN